jgi:hypothetical protein
MEETKLTVIAESPVLREKRLVVFQARGNLPLASIKLKYPENLPKYPKKFEE